MQFKVNTKYDWKRICNQSQNSTFSNTDYGLTLKMKKSHFIQICSRTGKWKNQILKGNTENWL